MNSFHPGAVQTNLLANETNCLFGCIKCLVSCLGRDMYEGAKIGI